MRCDEILELLSPFLDGELSDQQNDQVQTHLDQCPSCRALMTELDAIHDGCGIWEAEPPPELTRRILDNLPAQGAKRSGKLLYWKRWGALAAAMALIALAAWRAPKLLSVSQSDLQPPAQTVDGAAAYSRPSGEVDQPMEASTDEPDIESVPTLASALPPYVTGPGVSANTGLPTPMTDVDIALNDDFQQSSVATAGAGYGSENGLDPEAPTPAAKTVTATPTYFSYTATDTSDDLSAQKSDPEPDLTAEPRMLRISTVPSGYYDTADNAVAETPPIATDSAENALEEPLEELYAVTISAPDSISRYCGVLTLSNGAPVGNYPAQIQENGEIWYTLPATDFNALLQELDTQSVAYALRSDGEDISPLAQEGLLIVTG